MNTAVHITLVTRLQDGPTGHRAAAHGAIWEEIAAKYKLKRVSYADLVAWPFADYVFGADWDVMSDVTKSPLYGFHDVVDSEAMFERLLRRFREERIVP